MDSRAQLDIQTRMAVFEAIRDQKSDRLLKLVIHRGLVNATWELPTVDEVPELLTYVPPAISIAAYLGARDVVAMLRNNGAALDVPDRHGRMPLHFAAAANHGIFNMLLEYGADVTAKDSVGRGVMHYAASCPDAGLAQQLVIEGNLPIDEADKCGMTPLMLAAREGSFQLVKMLLDAGANADGQFQLPGLNPRNLFHFACESDCVEVAERFFKPEFLEMVSPDGTPLVVAAMRGRGKMVEYLLSKGANVQAKDPDGSAPLMLAARVGSYTAVKALLDAGSNVDQLNSMGECALALALNSGSNACVLVLLQRNASTRTLQDKPLAIAVKQGNMALLHFLLANGVSLDQRDVNGNTALHLLIERNLVNDIREVVETCPESLDLKDSRGNTPLLLAAFNGQCEIMSILLENGADIDATNSKGYTALAVAARKRNARAVSTLLEFAANPDVPDNEGRTPLFVACQDKQLDIVRLLVENGATIDYADKSAHTPLYYAVMSEAYDVIRYLKEKGAQEKVIAH